MTSRKTAPKRRKPTRGEKGLGHWRYIVIRRRNVVAERDFPYLALHEGYFNADGKMHSYTAEPVDVIADDEQDMRATLVMMLSDAIRYPVIDETDLPDYPKIKRPK